MTDDLKTYKYLLVVDPVTASDPSFRKFIVFIDNAEFTKDWHSPFLGFIMLTSNEKFSKIGTIIADFLGSGARFSVSRVEGMENMGLLPLETWNWMNDSGFSTGDVPKPIIHQK